MIMTYPNHPRIASAIRAVVEESEDFRSVFSRRTARGEWALLTDADLSSPIEEPEKLWRAAEVGRLRLRRGSAGAGASARC
jgi:hypothetical protein